MKHIDYSFTDSDILACIFSLTQLHLLHDDDDDISDAQIAINEQCAVSAGDKLASGNVDRLTPNELRILCCCITYCNMVCQGEISTDSETYKECMKYVFTLNKLDNNLSSQIF